MIETRVRPNREERRQREHELAEALIAARQLQARLEMLGDRVADVRIIESLRNSLAIDMVGLAAPAVLLVSDDVDDDGRPNEWNAAAWAEAAGERAADG